MSLFEFDEETASSVAKLAALHQEFMRRFLLFHHTWEHHLHLNGASLEDQGPYSTPGIMVGRKGTLILSAYKHDDKFGDLIWLHSENEPGWHADVESAYLEDLVPVQLLSEESRLWLDRPENEQAYLHVDLVLRHRKVYERWMGLVEIWKLEGYATEERIGTGISLETDGRLQLAAYNDEGDLVMTITSQFGDAEVSEELFPAYGGLPRSAGMA